MSQLECALRAGVETNLTQHNGRSRGQTSFGSSVSVSYTPSETKSNEHYQLLLTGLVFIQTSLPSYCHKREYCNFLINYFFSLSASLFCIRLSAGLLYKAREVFQWQTVAMLVFYIWMLMLYLLSNVHNFKMVIFCSNIHVTRFSQLILRVQLERPYKAYQL